MAQRGEGVPDRRSLLASAPVVVAIGIALAAITAVVVLRAANRGVEPEGENWWVLAELVVALAYLPTGALLLARPDRRVVGGLLIAVGGAALVDALATQYRGYASSRPEPPALPALAASSTWAWVFGAAVAGTGLLLAIHAGGGSRRRRALYVVSGVGVAALLASELGASWPDRIGENPFEVSSGTGARALDVAGVTGQVVVDLVATLAVALLAWRWWTRRQAGDTDLLPAWLLVGGVAVWLAMVPSTVAGVGERLPAPHVVAPILLIATVPLLVVGLLVEVVRTAPAGVERANHRFLEWLLLAGGIVLIYTALVAGLGRLVGGGAPTWLLVAATGGIAIAIEPARRRTRSIVDRLAYGQRDDPLRLVRQVVDRVGATDMGQALLPALAASIGEEMRLDAVAIDVAGPNGWQREAAYGRPIPDGNGATRELTLRHHEQVVGRLIVARSEAPALRARDDATLDELVAPLALAVSWVRLAEDLRRSGLAVVTAREEERRRIRRDLHDGLGPALTGISLGLRAAVRQVERTDAEPRTLMLLHRLADEVDSTVTEVKRIVRDLRPSALDELGLVGAVTEFAHRLDGALHVHLEIPDADPALPAAVEVAAYRIVTEALTNVVRHASAEQCWLRIATPEDVEIDVVDDGVGVDAAAIAGVGLAGMRERAVALGGDVTVGARPPHGTHVHVRLPAVLPAVLP